MTSLTTGGVVKAATIVGKTIVDTASIMDSWCCNPAKCAKSVRRWNSFRNGQHNLSFSLTLDVTRFILRPVLYVFFKMFYCGCYVPPRNWSGWVLYSSGLWPLWAWVETLVGTWVVMWNGNLLKSRVSEICVKWIRVNQGVGVFSIQEYLSTPSLFLESFNAWNIRDAQTKNLPQNNWLSISTTVDNKKFIRKAKPTI